MTNREWLESLSDAQFIKWLGNTSIKQMRVDYANLKENVLRKIAMSASLYG